MSKNHYIFHFHQFKCIYFYQSLRGNFDSYFKILFYNGLKSEFKMVMDFRGLRSENRYGLVFKTLFCSNFFSMSCLQYFSSPNLEILCWYLFKTSFYSFIGSKDPFPVYCDMVAGGK